MCVLPMFIYSVVEATFQSGFFFLRVDLSLQWIEKEKREKNLPAVLNAFIQKEYCRMVADGNAEMANKGAEATFFGENVQCLGLFSLKLKNEEFKMYYIHI